MFWFVSATSVGRTSQRGWRDSRERQTGDIMNSARPVEMGRFTRSALLIAMVAVQAGSAFCLFLLALSRIVVQQVHASHPFTGCRFGVRMLYSLTIPCIGGTPAH